MQKKLDDYGKLKEQNEELLIFKENIEGTLAQPDRTEKYIQSMEKWLDQEVEFYREGGISLAYADELAKEEMKKHIAELMKKRDKELKKRSLKAASYVTLKKELWGYLRESSSNLTNTCLYNSPICGFSYNIPLLVLERSQQYYACDGANRPPRLNFLLDKASGYEAIVIELSSATNYLVSLPPVQFFIILAKPCKRPCTKASCKIRYFLNKRMVVDFSETSDVLKVPREFV